MFVYMFVYLYLYVHLHANIHNLLLISTISITLQLLFTDENYTFLQWNVSFIDWSSCALHRGVNSLNIHKMFKDFSSAGLDVFKVNMNGKPATYLISSTSSAVKELPNAVLYSNVKFAVSDDILFNITFYFYFLLNFFTENTSRQQFINLNYARRLEFIWKNLLFKRTIKLLKDRH